MVYEKCGNNIVVKTDKKNFNIQETLDCGQCFRFVESEGIFTGVAYGKIIRISQAGNRVTFYKTTEEEFKNTWIEYFDLNTNYAEIKKTIGKNEIIRKACEFAGGIHIMKQEPWETLCSFIISQNNNIPRIKGIIARFCERFGKKISDGYYSFPSPKIVAALTFEELNFLRAGFRTKYIMDAAEKVCGGLQLDKIKNLSYQEGKNELMKIKGVGPKVADCVLLYGFYKIEAFPMDIWMKRVIHEYFRDGFPEYAKIYGGMAQQYLFHYIRNIKNCNYTSKLST